MDAKEWAAIIGLLVTFFGIIWGGMKLSVRIGSSETRVNMRIDALEEEQEEMKKQFTDFMGSISRDIREIANVKSDFQNNNNRMQRLEQTLDKFSDKFDTIIKSQSDMAVQLAGKQNRS